MAFPETCEGAISAMKESATQSLNSCNLADIFLTSALMLWTGGDDHGAIQLLISAVQFTIDGAAYAGYGYSPFDNEGPWAYYFTNCIEGGTITMADVINVMESASNDELKTFIGLVDAYRISLWNKPFESDFFASIARGFE